jgi:hypothetical protein
MNVTGTAVGDSAPVGGYKSRAKCPSSLFRIHAIRCFRIECDPESRDERAVESTKSQNITALPGLLGISPVSAF